MIPPPRKLLAALRRPAYRPLPIGLDVEGGSVRMVQLAADAGGRPRVVAAARRAGGLDVSNVLAARGGGPWLDPDAAAAVSDLLRRGGFHGRRVVVAVPQEMMRFRTLRVPAAGAADAAELPRLLAREAREALGVDVTRGEHLVHFLPGDALRRGGETHQEGLLAVVARADVDALVAAFDDCGAIVAGVDLPPMSLYRGVQRFNRRRRDGEDVHVLVRVGRRATTVVIGRGAKMSFLKSVGVGTDAMHAAVGRKLGVGVAEAAELCRGLLARRSDEMEEPGDAAAWRSDPVRRSVTAATRPIVENLGRELSLCLRYYCVTFQCKRPERVLLCGPLADDARLVEMLAEAVALPVEPRRPLADAEVPAELAESVAVHGEEWDMAMGLALRHAPSGLAGRAGLSRLTQATADAEGEADKDCPPASPSGEGEADASPAKVWRREPRAALAGEEAVHV